LNIPIPEIESLSSPAEQHIGLSSPEDRQELHLTSCTAECFGTVAEGQGAESVEPFLHQITLDLIAATEMDTESEYLKSSVGDALTQGLAATAVKQPNDPVEFLGNFLVAFVGAKNALLESSLFMRTVAEGHEFLQQMPLDMEETGQVRKPPVNTKQTEKVMTNGEAELCCRGQAEVAQHAHDLSKLSRNDRLAVVKERSKDQNSHWLKRHRDVRNKIEQQVMAAQDLSKLGREERLRFVKKRAHEKNSHWLRRYREVRANIQQQTQHAQDLSKLSRPERLAIVKARTGQQHSPWLARHNEVHKEIKQLHNQLPLAGIVQKQKQKRPARQRGAADVDILVIEEDNAEGAGTGGIDAFLANQEDLRV
jgi:hypothetical protein